MFAHKKLTHKKFELDPNPNKFELNPYPNSTIIQY